MTTPFIPITDPSFKWVDSSATNIRDRFNAARKKLGIPVPKW